MKTPNTSDELEMLVTRVALHSRTNDFPAAVARLGEYLDERSAPYVLVGRAAMARYCRAQFTNDLVVRIKQRSAALDLESIFPAGKGERSTVRLETGFVSSDAERRLMAMSVRTDWLGADISVAAAEHLLWLACSSSTLLAHVDAIGLWNSGHIDEAIFNAAAHDRNVRRRAAVAKARAERQRSSTYSAMVERRIAELRSRQRGDASESVAARSARASPATAADPY